ncbi:flavodoxin-dependent (E)-4-hydroxy-3-methylbut-2-enyl-diphosphate synthase [Verrucomicrobiota bacterium]
MKSTENIGGKRRNTRQVHVGSVAVGGGASISVQTMTKTDTRDVATTISQIQEVQALGCDIVRLAVPDESAVKAFAEIRKKIKIPLVADIHFDHKLAVLAVEAGADAIRINPGNIGGTDKVKEVVSAAQTRNVPIRIGVNSGSLEKDIAEKYGASAPQALVESAIRHVRILEDVDYNEIIISAKANDVQRTVDTYRLLSSQTDYPLHVGVTEAGTFLNGTVRSSVAMGILLTEGIGDTIRVSLTDTPAREVRVGLELLRSLGLRKPGPGVVSCPTCGRIEVDVVTLAGRVEEELEKFYVRNPDASRPLVAVMGCMVNGPGEAKEADIALAGGKGKFALYVRGEHVSTVDESDALKALLEQVRAWKDIS